MEATNKYQNGKIYTLRSHTTEMFYIGSTYNDLSRRKAQHKAQKMNEIARLEDFYIELLEAFPCDNREELNKREGELIREHRDTCVNIKIEGRTRKEYRKDNKEAILEKDKVYYEANKEVKAEYKKIYYKKNKETLSEQKKVWYQDNKDAIKEKNKAWKEANRDKINTQRRARRASKKSLE